jgi:hypothetical protein
VGRTQIIIAKHRNGSIADVDMRFRADEVRFVDERESMVNQAAELTAAANVPPPGIPQGYVQIASMGVDDMPPSYGSNEFGQNDFM